MPFAEPPGKPPQTDGRSAKWRPFIRTLSTLMTTFKTSSIGWQNMLRMKLPFHGPKKPSKEPQTHVTLGGTKRFSILSEMLILTKSHFCTPGPSSEEWLVGNCCPHSWCSAHITKHMWKIGEGSGGKWQVGHNRGYSVHIHCFISGGTPRKRPVSISKETDPFFLNSPGVYKVKIDVIKTHQNSIETTRLGQGILWFAYRRISFLPESFAGALRAPRGVMRSTVEDLEHPGTKENTSFVPSWTYLVPPLFGWPFCGELISKRLQKLADSPCYSLVIFVVHEAGRETRGKRAGVEATRTVIQQQKN